MQNAPMASRGFPATMRVVGGLLRPLALDIGCHTHGVPVGFYLLAVVSIAVYMYTYHVSVYWFIFTRGRGDVLLSLILFSLGISSLIGTVKLLYMYRYSKHVKQSVSEHLECDAGVAPGSRASRSVLAALAPVRRRAAAFWLLVVGNGLVYVLQPLLTPGRHLMEDKQILLGLEPMFESPKYEIAFLAESISVMFTVYAPASITAFFIVVVGHTEAQMLALSQELLHLWADAQHHYQKTAENSEVVSHSTQDASLTSDTIRNARAAAGTRVYVDKNTARKTIINDYVKQRLVNIIETHAINIGLIKRVEAIFQGAIAIEFALLSAGLTAELLGGLENTYVQVPFALGQVAVDCFVGQKLMDANHAFAEAAYGCGWEQFDVSNAKLLLVVLQNAQRTMKLSAGGVATLSYSSLMTVLKSIYSVFTALRSTMKD